MRQTTLFFLILLAGKGFSQDYLPFPTDSAIWGSTFTTFGFSPPYQTSVDKYYWIIGDTVINENNYKIFNSYLFSTSLHGYLREEDKRIYYIREGQPEVVLYDFNISLNDTIQIPGPEFSSTVITDVIKIDSVLVNSFFRKRFTLREIDGETWCLGDHVWIEGIGSVSHGLFYPEISWVDHSAYLKCHSHNDVPIYGGGCPSNVYILNNEFPHIFIYPNPAQNEIFINGLVAGEIQIINLKGNIVKQINITSSKTIIDISQLPSGIYLINLTSNHESIVKKFIKL